MKNPFNRKNIISIIDSECKKLVEDYNITLHKQVHNLAEEHNAKGTLNGGPFISRIEACISDQSKSVIDRIICSVKQEQINLNIKLRRHEWEELFGKIDVYANSIKKISIDILDEWNKRTANIDITIFKNSYNQWIVKYPSSELDLLKKKMMAQRDTVEVRTQKKALWISIWALIVSIVSIYISIKNMSQ